MKQHYFLGTLLAALLVGGVAAPAGAQALNYFAVNAQTMTTTYTDLGTTGTAIATPDFDDSNSAAQPLGFSFSYGGASYSQFVLNTNGYLKLGAAAPVAPYFSSGAQDVSGGPLNSSDTNLLLPFNTDLEAGTGPTEYRVATTGAVGSRLTTIQWKNVSDKARAASATNATLVPKQYANLSFQVRLYEATGAIEFAYGEATASTNAATNSYLNVGLKGNGTAANQLSTVLKNSGNSWVGITFQDGNYAPASTAFGIRNSFLPFSNFAYHFNAALANDAALTTLYNIEQLPAGQAFAYRARVVNKGSLAQPNLPVTLTLSGANPATLTQTVSLAPGAATVVTWPALTLAAAGTSTVLASTPADDSPTDNSQTATTTTSLGSPGTPALFSYTKGGSLNGSTGFGPNQNGTPYVGASLAAYTTTTAFTFTQVRVLLGSSGSNVGQQVYGLLADQAGKTLAQSPDYTIQSGDLGTFHTFVFATPVTVPAGTVLAGLAQKVNTVLFFGLGMQTETPGRLGTFYIIFNPTGVGSSTPSDTNASGFANSRFLIDAGGYPTVITATAAPALTQALTVFPNPSATGQVSLAIQGTNAPAGLAVSVINQLGQVVYTGTAHDNATTALDLSQLAAGLYRVQVRHGSTFTSQPLSIVR